MNHSEGDSRGIVIGTSITASSWQDVLTRISRWAGARESRVVAICNVHSVVTAKFDSEFKVALEAADIATPDGAPLVWLLRAQGYKGQERINGPDLMWKYCKHAESSGQSVFLLGSTPQTLNSLGGHLINHFPGLHIAGSHSPPFRRMTKEEDEELVKLINNSAAQILFVSLGCPKQEKWMHEHRGRVHSVMIGVGAAFDYHSGMLRRAPEWMQKYGLEWFYRLLREPRRLWRRYLVTNSLFLIYAAAQLLSSKQANKTPS